MATLLSISRKIATRKRWALAVVVCGLALLAGVRPVRDKLALSKLETRIDQEIAGSFDRDLLNTLSLHLINAFIWAGLQTPDWFFEIMEQRNNVITPSADQRIASSRWPLRRAMADSILRNDRRAEFLMKKWEDYFPAIIGTDVTLEHRREWISHLDTLRTDASLTRTPRQAAVFCMALVILTDPSEFENWRVKVRDAMLGWPEPLTSSNEEVWMRTLDTLLAMDPPESWVALTEPLTASRDFFRYAMRIPVRGLAGHFVTLSREFEFFESRNDLENVSDLWDGVDASLQAWPDIFGKAETANIRDWQRAVVFRGFMDHSTMNRGYDLGNSTAREWLKFTPEQQQQLAATAADRARLACEEIVSAGGSAKRIDPVQIAWLRETCPYLTNQQQTVIGRLLIPVMLRPDFFHRSGPLESIRFNSDWVKLLWKIHPLMTVDERKMLQAALIPLMGNLCPYERSSAVLLCLDAWSDMPSLSQENWLALAWPFKSSWRIVPRDTPRESLDPFADGPLPVPPVADSVAKQLATHLDAAYSTGDLTTFSNSLNLALNGGGTSAPVSPANAYHSYGEIRNWRLSGALASHSVAEVLEMELYLSGLRVLDDDGLRALKVLVKNDRNYYFWRALLNRPSILIDPWIDLGINPQEAVRWMGHEVNAVLLGDMLMCMEKFPPDAAIIRAIWDELRQSSQSASIEDKAKTFGVLFRLSRRLPLGERLAMRGDFLAAYRTKGFRPSSYDVNYREPEPPLYYLGGGLGIPWEDDELSAELSWRANVERQVHLYPLMTPELYANEVFSFLVFGSYREKKSIQWPQIVTAMPRLSAPFEPTPWQRARELHLRRPELD